MNIPKPTRLWGLITAGVMLFATAMTAHAVGTASGVTVGNTATISYSVGGVGQTPIESSPTGNSTPGAGTPTNFLVDNRVDVTVAEVGATWTTGAPGQALVVTTFTVTNTGNTAQDYALSAANVAAGQTLFADTDDADVTITGVYVESGGGAGYQDGVDTATFIDELAAAAVPTPVTVYVVATIPAALVDTNYAIVSLTATTHDAGAAGLGALTAQTNVGLADDPLLVDVVFADSAGSDDGANNGAHSARDAYLVGSAALTVQKTSAVVEDPVLGVSVNAKAIPGARVTYTIVVTNNGGSAATSVTLRDAIPANTTYVPGSIVLSTAVPPAQTDAGGDDAGDYNVTNAGEVTVVIGNLAGGGGTATVTFDVTIN